MKPEEQQQIISIHTVASSRILSYIQSPHTVNSEVTWKAVKKEKSINTCQQTYKKITLNECPENTEKPQLPRPSLWTCLVISRWCLTLDTTAGPDLDPDPDPQFGTPASPQTQLITTSTSSDVVSQFSLCQGLTLTGQVLLDTPSIEGFMLNTKPAFWKLCGILIYQSDTAMYVNNSTGTNRPQQDVVSVIYS